MPRTPRSGAASRVRVAPRLLDVACPPAAAGVDLLAAAAPGHGAPVLDPGVDLLCS